MTLNMGFSAIDYVVLLLYLAGITIFGVRFRRSQRTVKDYFLGDKNTSWIVISLSIVATETSTLTLIGVPALAYANYAKPDEGGIAAVIWTDLIQLVIYIGGSLLAAYELLHLVPGGWQAIAAEASAAGKFQFVSFKFDLSVPFTFWAGLLGGTFLTMASHGTDQLLVQRLLTCRNKRESQIGR